MLYRSMLYSFSSRVHQGFPIGAIFVNHVKKLFFSLDAAAVQKPFAAFRTIVDDPTQHTLDQEGRYYTIPNDIQTKLFPFYGFPKVYLDQIKTFRETSIMVRQSAIELIGYLEQTDFTKPAVRYVIYGDLGVGKTLTLSHIVHYAYCKQWFIIDTPPATNWTAYPKEYTASLYNPERIDTPLDSALWLQQFRSQNAHLLQKYDVRVSKKYEWSKREVVEEGEPLVSVIEHGVARMKHASDCMAVVLKEIKQQSQEKNFRVLVACDGVNAFFMRTRILRPDKSLVSSKDVTPARAFMKLLQNDWVNACIVTTTGHDCAPLDHRESYNPFYLLGQEGYELLEPFVPVLVANYSPKEIDSCLDYYIDRLWIQSPAGQTEGGRAELKFLSGHHPSTLMKLCASI